MLKFVYSFFLGLLLVIFVGMGVASFYPAPKSPEYPKVLQKAQSDQSYNADQKMANDTYQTQIDEYGKKERTYRRNASIIVLTAAVILMAVSLLVHTKLTVLADGLLLGGTFSLIYSIGLSFAADSPKYSFSVVSVGIAVTMLVGYLKFIRPPTPVKKSK